MSSVEDKVFGKECFIACVSLHDTLYIAPPVAISTHVNRFMGLSTENSACPAHRLWRIYSSVAETRPRLLAPGPLAREVAGRPASVPVQRARPAFIHDIFTPSLLRQSPSL